MTHEVCVRVQKRENTPGYCGIKEETGALMLASGNSHLLSYFSVIWHLITGRASISTNVHHCSLYMGNLDQETDPLITQIHQCGPLGYRAPL